MSDTPRTDDVFFALYENAGEAQTALYEHACKLEREFKEYRRLHGPGNESE